MKFGAAPATLTADPKYSAWKSTFTPEEWARQVETAKANSFVTRSDGMSFSFGNALKKAASVVTNTAAGFVGGGGIGSIAGAARGIINNTKTGKAETINLRTGGQAFVTGAVANIAAGAVASGAHALAGASGAGGASGLLSKGFAALKGNGVMGILAKNAGGIASGFAQLFSKPGAVQGAADAIQGAAGAVDSVSSEARDAYDRFSQNNPDVANTITGAITKAKDRAINKGKQLLGVAPPAAPVVNVSAPGGGDSAGGLPPAVLLAGAGILAFMFVGKKK